ncbi:metal-binding protein ZinT [Labrenzia sp. CE80]|uniref:ZinT family metal-binding protein n=1 Tax=Labrenzia sp. CE80 TaxID=1788986 RepID=UPI00129B37C8|nr:metal-binding protein ZinT [Labrenzia sp. CE80]
MQNSISKSFGAFALGAAVFISAQALASQNTKKDTGHTHKHSHSKSHGKSDAYRGYFKDEDIKPRPLTDWQGEWQSIYPYLKDGTLDPVMEEKAAHGDKSADEYRAYYETGYKTDVFRIDINHGDVSFHEEGHVHQGSYVADGTETLTYKKGNRGVRYIFKKVSGDAEAPVFIQFSDHKIAPAPSDHFHLYWGNDRAELLNEVTNWPTYFPASLTGQQIVEEMLAH